MGVVAFFMASLGACILFFRSQYLHALGGSKEIVFEVPQGMSLIRAAVQLEELQVLKNAQMAVRISRILDPDLQIKVGEYAIKSTQSPREIFHTLASGVSIQRSFVIPEGRNLFEIAMEIPKTGLASPDEFLKLVRDPLLVRELLGESLDSLEGYLFPETYFYTKASTLTDLVRRMVQKSLAVVGELQKTYPELAARLSRHELVTFASLVEKETGAPEERSLIASVFWNRIQKKMRLQTDPSTLYAMALISGQLVENIRRQDLLNPHPYNTYQNPGLPPGPIANPGREALLAVLKPAVSSHLFFVSRNDGTHVFSDSYEQHQDAVRRFQLDPRAREGKSWRDLQKRNSSDSKSSHGAQSESGKRTN